MSFRLSPSFSRYADWRVLCTAALIAGLTGLHCAPTDPLSTPTASGGLVVHLTLPNGVTTFPTAKAVITRVRLQITGEGMEPLDTLLAVRDGLAEARIAGIPVGRRTVAAGLEDAQGTQLWQGRTEVAIQADRFAAAVIALSRVDDTPPALEAIDIPPSLQAGAPIRLVVSAEDVHDATDSLQVRWDFDGDGAFDTDWSYAKEQSHAFTSPGSYTVRVEVRDRSSRVAAQTRTVEVTDIPTVEPNDESTALVQITIADDPAPADAQITIQIAESDAEITVEIIEEETADAEVTVEIED